MANIVIVRTGDTYPVVIRRSGRREMLYGGNGYGRTGIGLTRQLA